MLYHLNKMYTNSNKCDNNKGNFTHQRLVRLGQNAAVSEYQSDY
jgi:hypothetical protein